MVYCTCCEACNPPKPRVRTPEEIKASEARSDAKERAYEHEMASYRKEALRRVLKEADFRKKHVTLC